MSHLRGKISVDYLDAATLLSGGVALVALPGNKYYVDGTNGSDTTGTGRANKPFATIGKGILAAAAGDTVFVRAQKIVAGSTDPASYAETVIIPATKPSLNLVGLSDGPAQGNQPQMKIGAGAVAMITVRAPGCVI